jgi:hypothetical protein
MLVSRARPRCDGRAGGAQPPQRKGKALSRHFRSTRGRGGCLSSGCHPVLPCSKHQEKGVTTDE